MKRIFWRPLRKRMGPYLQARVAEGADADRALSPRVDALREELERLRQQVEALASQLNSGVSVAIERADALAAALVELRAITAADYDRIPELRAALRAVRASEEYAAVWERDRPLITVRIATYNRVETLLERTLPSVLAQTYPHFEVVVVGDHCTDDTAARLAALDDDRVRFHNLPYRADYPQDDRQRWMVAGTPGVNIGNDLARGDWIAPLDDDDTWTPDHLELLLDLALAGRYEVAYGLLRRRNVRDGTEMDLYRYPPARAAFGFQGALMLRQLTPLFENDERSFVVNEPGDWNLCRRMLLAGVRFGSTESCVGHLFIHRDRRITTSTTGP
jgi:cellulose synthase/poly-beta-1,6-N-acetylglucosamine synthase-like glycosyltransferase